MNENQNFILKSILRILKLILVFFFKNIFQLSVKYSKLSLLMVSTDNISYFGKRMEVSWANINTKNNLKKLELYSRVRQKAQFLNVEEALHSQKCDVKLQ